MRQHRAWALVVWVGCWLLASGARAADLPDVIAAVKPAVLSIVAYSPDNALPSLGTGWLITADRFVTCRHVLGGADRAEVRLPDGSYAEVAGLLAEDRDWDLALCRLSRPIEGVLPLKCASALPQEGESVLMIGGPLGLEWTSSVGIISALRELPGLGTALQHTAAVSAGNSGGPVLNMSGQVVGVQTSTIAMDNKIIAVGQELNFAVPAQLVLSLKEGALRSLAEIATEVPANWRATSTVLLDKTGLRPFSKGDFEGALGYFEEAAKRQPDVADVWLRLAMSHEKLGHLDQAAASYRRAVELDPKLAIAYNNLGVVLSRQKQTAEAIVELKKALDLSPQMLQAYANLANCYNDLKSHDQALAACQKGLSFDRNYANLRYTLGLTYVYLGHKPLAIEQARLLEALNAELAQRLRREIDGSTPK